MKEYRLTREGYEKLKKEKEDLINNKRKEIAERLKEAKNLGGDLTENSEYDDAKNEQAFIEGRIKQIDDILNNCVIIDGKGNKGTVDLGSIVVVKDVDKKSEKEFKIVSSIESSPEESKISDESPMGMALIGKKVGEEVIVKTPTDTRRFEIISIK
ncbi:MAG: transcription elongation factor GreA [Candidatus Humimicrobiaceae bacterium]|jgi:transcription elongation factor GreA|nr:transcription elongation factor GreA [Actinomycetota bacterium]MDD5601081.1 transcription elongation factor GreA [Actinomycetota bacterium]MDY0027848.1 transcription elongation factor GreA [Candidatus Humimicrobiaceae bacterium]